MKNDRYVSEKSAKEQWARRAGTEPAPPGQRGEKRPQKDAPSERPGVRSTMKDTREEDGGYGGLPGGGRA